MYYYEYSSGVLDEPLFPVDTSKINLAAQIIMYIMIVLDGSLGLVCCMVLLRSLRASKRWTIVKLLKLTLPWPVTGTKKTKTKKN